MNTRRIAIIDTAGQVERFQKRLERGRFAALWRDDGATVLRRWGVPADAAAPLDAGANAR